ncbi:hypothetical protein [Paraburkholderia phenazinium]|uniref:hypothetical protein n=1 Tax=Paraburkholderia phenazinium TaxID=60549 RepID=UPI00158C2CF4|nr:hypothetical protein [Paraburkholderia phenazinium]
MGFKAHAFFLFLFFMLDHGTTNMGAWHILLPLVTLVVWVMAIIFDLGVDQRSSHY